MRRMLCCIGSKQANSSTPSQGNASPGDQQDTSPTENPNTNEGSETEARKDDTVDIGRLEQNQSQSKEKVMMFTH